MLNVQVLKTRTLFKQKKEKKKETVAVALIAGGATDCQVSQVQQLHLFLLRERQQHAYSCLLCLHNFLLYRRHE